MEWSDVYLEYSLRGGQNRSVTIEYDLCSTLLCRPVCVMRLFATFEPEQRDAQAIELEEHAIEGGLIGQWTRQDGRSCWLVSDLQARQPILPGQVEVTFDANVILHLRPPVQVLSTACGCSLAHALDLRSSQRSTKRSIFQEVG